MQHDCITAGCWDTETVPIRQERQETTRMKQIVQHVVGDEDIYLLNSHALHNYQHLANVIPTHLKLQICVVADGKSARARAAKGLRENAASKKAAATAEKGKATSASAEDGEAQTYQESLEDTEIVVDSATPQVAHADLEDGENPGDMEICGQRNIVHGAADGHAVCSRASGSSSVSNTPTAPFDIPAKGNSAKTRAKPSKKLSKLPQRPVRARKK